MTSPFDDPREGVVGNETTNAFGERIESENGAGPFATVHTFAKSADQLKTQATFAKKTGNYRWLNRIKSQAQSLSELVGQFIVEALKIALAKFVIELCALIIDSLMTALTGINKKVDITTPNVFYSKTSPEAARAATASTSYNDPWGTSAPRFGNTNPFA